MIETRMDIDWMLYMSSIVPNSDALKGFNPSTQYEWDVYNEISNQVHDMHRGPPLNLETLRSRYLESKHLGM
jgi:hypothetical protein